MNRHSHAPSPNSPKPNCPGGCAQPESRTPGRSGISITSRANSPPSKRVKPSPTYFYDPKETAYDAITIRAQPTLGNRPIHPRLNSLASSIKKGAS